MSVLAFSMHWIPFVVLLLCGTGLHAGDALHFFGVRTLLSDGGEIAVYDADGRLSVTVPGDYPDLVIVRDGGVIGVIIAGKKYEYRLQKKEGKDGVYFVEFWRDEGEISRIVGLTVGDRVDDVRPASSSTASK